ncbi:MAG TPA: hypothetical protein VFZ25_09890 [Chloroflexota bacterium]|nr:hypothetical protein [Chloroflexota bacterium]
MPEKYEREIEEILRRSSFQPSRPKRRSGWLAGFVSEGKHFSADVSPLKLLAFGIILALAGYLIGAFLPTIGGFLSLLAVVFLVGGFVLEIRRRRYHRPPLWRGRRVDEPISYREVWRSFKRRWDTWRGHDGGSDYRRN